jgi:hypothetical protein
MHVGFATLLISLLSVLQLFPVSAVLLSHFLSLASLSWSCHGQPVVLSLAFPHNPTPSLPATHPPSIPHPHFPHTHREGRLVVTAWF